MSQVPHGPEHLTCPAHDKAMSKVCHKCPLWTQVRGGDPQDAMKTVDRWDCAMALLPMLLIENARQQRSTAAAVETMTHEMKKTDTDSQAVIGTLLTALNRSYDAVAALPRSNEQHGPALLG